MCVSQFACNARISQYGTKHVLVDVYINLFFELPAAGLCIQQSPVLCNLHFKSGLDVQKHLVLLTLALQITAELHQLALHSTHLQARGEKTELLTSF